jgi:X-Pro dipeptidyl-peptidase
MRLPFRVAGLLAAALTASALVTPSTAVEYGSVTKEYIVPTRHASLHIAVAHPTVNGKIRRAAGVLTYSPYYGTLSTRLSDASTWTREGFARISADVIGTGESGGCYDYGGKRDKETGYDLVEWIAKQPWSTGKVGMIGGSYDGTTAMATAVMRPPHLTTIIPEAAISRWYDYAYSTGMRYSLNNERMGHQDPGLIIDEQGFDTPLLFDFGLSVPPPLDYDQPDWQERFVSSVTPCDEVLHVQSGYNPNPDYTAFWSERDYAKDAHKVTIPVLVALNWGDWNVKQETGIRYWEKLTKSRFRRLAVGTRWAGHGTPSGDSNYRELRVEWMRHFLQGARNGVDRTPPVISQLSDSKGPGKFYKGPVPRTTTVNLYAQQVEREGYPQVLLPTKPRKPYGPGVSYPLDAKGTESGALAAARDGKEAAWFETPPLTKDVRIFGAPKIKVWSTVERSWVTYSVSVVDIDPAHFTETGTQRHPDETTALLGITRGWMDSRYRNTLTKRQAWQPGLNGVTIVAKPQDYTFRKGHSIGLLITDQHDEWVVAKPYDDPAAGATPLLTVDTTGRTVLSLPVVGKVTAKSLF